MSGFGIALETEGYAMTRFNNYDLSGMPPVLSWNPIVMRCTRVSPGCQDCWHLRMCHRMAANPSFSAARRSIAGGKAPPAMAENWQDMLKRKAPAVIAVQFMGDLWHPDVTPGLRWIVLNEICMASQHIFLLLTKRPFNVVETLPGNAWLGTSVEDTHWADLRVRSLILAPGARHRWISVEPMLGPVDIRQWMSGVYSDSVQFVAAGPETGPHARRFHPAWIDAEYELLGVQAQCRAYSVPFYDKRAGGLRQWPKEWIEAVGSAERNKEGHHGRTRTIR